MWPSVDLRTVVLRPTFDRSPSGITTFDPRTTLAILDPDRATWGIESRLTDQQGLELIDQIQQLVVTDSLVDVSLYDIDLELQLHQQPSENDSSMAFPGGQWRILKIEEPSSRSILQIGVVDVQTGEVIGQATMDLVAARDLMYRLAAAIRSPGS